jgi:SEC-C motif domain protein
MAMKSIAKSSCPCGTARAFGECCGPYLSGQAVAPNAEALMRSRYTAFTKRDDAYLLTSWHASTRPATVDLADDAAGKWIGLEVKRSAAIDADSAIVEFVARYKVGGRAQRLHEVSRFVREQGRWYYVSAVTSTPAPSPPPARTL